MAIPWADVEEALQAWVSTVTGIPVVWADQNARAPEGDFITMRLRGPRTVGVDAVATFYSEARPPAEAIEYRSQAMRELTLTLNAYSKETNRTTSARVHLAKLQSALHMPSTHARMRAAGLVLVDAGEVLNISALAAADIEGRAVMDVRVRLTDTESEFTTFIEKATITPPAAWDGAEPLTVDLTE
jgi:hypothetical protein